MAKLTLQDITSSTAGSNVTVDAANNALLEAALENTLSRDGTFPNEMESDFDINGYRLLNLPSPSLPTEPARLLELQAIAALVANGNDDDGFTVYVDSFGAVGDGVTDDTAAIQLAINSGLTVRVRPGAVYLVNGGLTQSTARQLLDFSGATIKLKDSASSKGILTISGQYAIVKGGAWNGNITNNSTGDQYASFAISLAEDSSSVSQALIYDFYGIGAKGVNVNNTTISDNFILNCAFYAVYNEGTGTDFTGNKIIGNYIEVSNTSARGIYLTGENSPYTNKQKTWVVSKNIVVGPSTGTGVAITVRGVSGVYSENQVSGFLLQHSLDITTDSVISLNRGVSPVTGNSYGLEINGGNNVITGNYMHGHYYGFACTGQNANNNVVSGNSFIDFTFHGIHVAPGSGKTALNWTITGNSFNVATAGASRVCVYLQGDCQYVNISGANTFVGPGSGVSNSRAIYLDTVGHDISIFSNRFQGWQRAVGVYSLGALAYANLNFNMNDCSEDMATTLLNIEGAATIGTGCQILLNSQLDTNRPHIFDVSGNTFLQWSDSFNTPNGNVTGGIGSFYNARLASRSPMFWLKENGTGNTGWRGIITNSVSADKGDAAATLTPGSSEHTNIWNTALTADRAVTLATSQIQNGARLRIVRTAASTGAFNLNVGTGPLKALAAGTWCDVEYNGSAWILTAYGAL